MQRGEGGDDFGNKVDVDGAEAAGVDVGFGLADAEVGGFVGADVQEGAGVVGGELGEHLLDVGERAGLAGGEDGAVGGFGEGAVLLPDEAMVEMPEGFLVGDDGDMELGGVGGELARVCRGDAAAGRRGERVRGVLLGFFEVGAVDVDLVAGESADEVLLEGERGDGAAREIVLHAAVAHGGVVADGGEVDGGGGAIADDELLESLGGVEKACGAGGFKLEAVGDGGDGVALGLLAAGIWLRPSWMVKAPEVGMRRAASERVSSSAVKLSSLLSGSPEQELQETWRPWGSGWLAPAWTSRGSGMRCRLADCETACPVRARGSSRGRVCLQKASAEAESGMGLRVTQVSVRTGMGVPG